MATERDKIVKKLMDRASDHERYNNPEELRALKLATFEALWRIFGNTVITPEAAHFNVGRLVEACEPYRALLQSVEEYDRLKVRLNAIDEKVEDK